MKQQINIVVTCGPLDSNGIQNLTTTIKSIEGQKHLSSQGDIRLNASVITLSSEDSEVAWGIVKGMKRIDTAVFQISEVSKVADIASKTHDVETERWLCWVPAGAELAPTWMSNVTSREYGQRAQVLMSIVCIVEDGKPQMLRNEISWASSFSDTLGYISKKDFLEFGGFSLVGCVVKEELMKDESLMAIISEDQDAHNATFADLLQDDEVAFVIPKLGVQCTLQQARADFNHITDDKGETE